MGHTAVSASDPLVLATWSQRELQSIGFYETDEKIITDPSSELSVTKMQNFGLTSACLRNCLNFQYQWIHG